MCDEIASDFFKQFDTNTLLLLNAITADLALQHSGTLNTLIPLIHLKS
jgi:hypothetical protein